MKKKLNCILLIDDDGPTNFIHKWVIDKAECTEKIEVCQGGEEALDFLKTAGTSGYPQPDLIFLDINMPGMNGWDFIEAYEKLPKEQQGNIIIMMLTTSLNPDDQNKAGSIKKITKFLSKPLTEEVLFTQLNKHFPDHF